MHATVEISFAIPGFMHFQVNDSKTFKIQRQKNQPNLFLSSQWHGNEETASKVEQDKNHKEFSVD